MTDREAVNPSDNPPHEDGRIHHNVRAVFPRACVLLAPMLSAIDRGGAISSYALARAVHDHFPELDSIEVDVLVAAVRRLQRQGGLRPE